MEALAIMEAAIRPQYDELGYDSGLHVVSVYDPEGGAFLDFYDIGYVGAASSAMGVRYDVYQCPDGKKPVLVGSVKAWRPDEVARVLMLSDAYCDIS